MAHLPMGAPPKIARVSLKGHIIKGRWKIGDPIGAGAFGEIYAGRDINTNKLVAVKFEPVASKKQVLKLEVAVLKKLQTCAWVVGFITCGRHHEYNYMVMELLAENISDLRRTQPGQMFSITTACMLGMQMLRALEAVHELGYLHRDIKPSNYAMGLAPDKKNTVYLIDFGLARKYVLSNGDVRPPRPQTGFRGTARYASINSHKSKDLGRRDDVWSLFYVLIEFVTGSLPWRRIKEKDDVGEMKIQLNDESLIAELPVEYKLWMRHLVSLSYGDKPHYKYLNGLLMRLFKRMGGTDSTPFDWEKKTTREVHRPRPIQRLEDLCFVQVASNIKAYDCSVIENPALKKRLLQFLIRINNGRLPRVILIHLLDSRLKDLDLMNCEFGESDFKYLAATCTELRSLRMGPTTDAIIKEVVSNNHQLEELSVYCSSRLSHRALRLVAENCPLLRVLKLKCSEKINDKSLEFMLRTCTNLEELSLFGCKKVKGTAFKAFGKTSSTKGKRSSNLKRLDLSYCELSRKGFKTLVKVASELEGLSFSPLSPSFKISASEFISLVHNCRNLTTFDLSNYHFEMDTILLEVSKTCTKLHTLLLDGIGITDYGLQNVVQNCRELRTLRYRYGDGVSDASLLAIASHCTELRSLTLDFWNKFNQLSVSDSAIKKLLCSCTQLQQLSLCNCMILTGSCFPESGYFPNLQSLNLSECIQLNDSAIKRVTESCPNLRRLDLNNLNNLTALSLQAIAAGCPLLDDLYLISCSCFTDNAIRALLIAMPRLFVQVTRYTDFDLRGSLKELQSTTVDHIFSRYPNTFRERAYEKTRKRLFGMDG